MNLYKYFYEEDGIETSGLTMAFDSEEALQKVIKSYELEAPFNGELINIVKLADKLELRGVTSFDIYESERANLDNMESVENTLEASYFELIGNTIIQREGNLHIN